MPKSRGTSAQKLPIMSATRLQRQNLGSRPLAHQNDNVCFATVNGIEYLRNPKYCKGLGFTIEERQVLGKFQFHRIIIRFV